MDWYTYWCSWCHICDSSGFISPDSQIHKCGEHRNMALDFCALILWFVRNYNELEVQSNRKVTYQEHELIDHSCSLERIQSYLNIEHEPKPTEAGIPPAAWPKSGELQVEHLFARYSTVRHTVARVTLLINTPTLIFVSRLVQRYYTMFLSMSNQIKGLELAS